MDQTELRRIAHTITTMRLVLIRATIADMRGDHQAYRRQGVILDGLGASLPRAARTEYALHHYVGWPARRTIERYGLIALAETNGYRP